MCTTGNGAEVVQEGEGGSLEQDFSGVTLFYVLVFNILHPAAKK